MSLTDKSIEELQIDDGEILVLKRRLAAEKQDFQGRLAQLNAQMATRIPDEQYQKIRSQRGQIVAALAALETKIGAANQRRAELQTVLEVRRRQSGAIAPEDVRKLVELRDHWHAYSMDAANHKRAREAAWKFSQQLREILKLHFLKAG